MIYLDSRVGSIDLAPLLTNLRVPCEVTNLDFADAWFGGNGPRGPSRFAFERKRINDALQCMTDHRLTGHQLPGMWAEYEHITIVFEGEICRCPQTGCLMEFYKGRWIRVTMGGSLFMWQSWENWINIMCYTWPGLVIKYTMDANHTARYLAATYQHMQSEWHTHGTAKGIYHPQPTTVDLGGRTPSLLRFTASRLPGVGWERAKAIERRFMSVRDMANATVADWLKPKIPGVGKTIAARAVEALTKTVELEDTHDGITPEG